MFFIDDILVHILIDYVDLEILIYILIILSFINLFIIEMILDWISYFFKLNSMRLMESVELGIIRIKNKDEFNRNWESIIIMINIRIVPLIIYNKL